MPEIISVSVLSHCLKTLCSETVLKILFVLRNGPRSVGELALLAGISSAAASNHLKALWNVEMVNRTREGQKVFYSLDEEALERIGKSLAEMGSLKTETET